MPGISYGGQSYPAQGYPVTGATVPATERYAMTVLGPDGVMVVKIGDISGLPWGASGYVLPDRTYGFWAKRAGVWFNQMPQVFYANADDLTTQISGIGGAPPGLFTFDIDEVLPFGEIPMPDGRIVSWEDTLYWHALTLVSAPGVTSPAVVAWDVLPAIFLASKDGGLSLAWNFLTGPGTGSGMSKYTLVTLRRRYKIQVSGTGGSGATWTFNVRRIAAIRMLAHEANDKPSLIGTFQGYAASATTTQKTRDGEDRNPSGGTGLDKGGYAGNLGGGGLAV